MQKVQNQQISAHCILACLYFLLLPTTIAVDSDSNSILKLATIPIAAFFVFTLIFSKRKLQINGVHLALLLFTFSVITTLFLDSSDLAVRNVTGYILNAALYICLSVIPYNAKELEWLEKTQILLLIILNALTLFSDGMRADRTTLIIMGQTCDPNYFVGFFIFPLTVAMQQIVSGKHRWANLALVAVSLYSVFLSGSRGGFLAVAVTIAAFALIYPSGIKNRFLLLLGGIAFLFTVFLVLRPVLPENIIERMTVESVVESGGTGRVDIWKSMLREVIAQPERLLFGRGILAIHQIFIAGKWNPVVAHNQLLQAVYNQGLVGLVIFLLLLGVSFFRCLKNRKAVSIALVGMMALSVSLSFNQTTRTFWNLIAYAAFAFPDDKIRIQENGGASDHE